MHSGQGCILIAAFFTIFLVMAGIMFAGLFKLVQYTSKKAQDDAVQRKDALQALAKELGFTYREEPHEDLTLPFKAFEDFDNDYNKHFSNILEGTYDDINWLIFDYRYRTPGTHSHHGTTHRKTVFCAFAAGFAYPRFTLGPEVALVGWLEKLNLFKDIDFESNPGFSGKYLLIGKDEQAIRSFFAPEILGFFESYFDKPEDIPKIEANEDRIIFTGMGNAIMDYIKPEKYRELLAMTTPIAKKFREVHSEIF